MAYIDGACYFNIGAKETKINEAKIYDKNGFLLKTISLTPVEIIYENYERITGMLDPSVRGKARPAKILISGHMNLGRCIYFISIKGQVMKFQNYLGPSDLEGLVQYQLDRKFGHKMDYQWILEQDIPIDDIYARIRKRSFLPFK